MAKSRNVSERERFSIKCLTDWMLMTAVFDPALLETPAVVLPEPDEKQIKEFAYLTDRGCDTVMLYASLLNVERLHKALPKISPRDLESLASSLESDLRRMVNLVKSHAHPIFVEGAEENDRRMRKTSGDGVRLTIGIAEVGSKKLVQRAALLIRRSDGPAQDRGGLSSGNAQVPTWANWTVCPTGAACVTALECQASERYPDGARTKCLPAPINSVKRGLVRRPGLTF